MSEAHIIQCAPGVILPTMFRPSVVDVRKLLTPEQRATVVYVGRACAGWPASFWRNPFKSTHRGSATIQVRSAASKYLDYFYKLPNLDTHLRELWAATKQGAKPLGCWCLKKRWYTPEPDPLAPMVDDLDCHAQLIAMELAERFYRPQS